MWFGMNLPDHRTIDDVQRVDNSVGVAEECRLPAIADGNCSLHCGGGLEHPPEASGRGIQRVDGAVFAAHEQSSCIGSRLTEGGRSSGKSECPFQLKVFQLYALQPCGA